MIKDKALEIALEALELHGKQYPHMVKGYCLDAIKAIKEALKTKDEQRTWVGLTDEEIFEIHKQVDSMQYLTFGKAIEAKLKEKNT
jgi:hypothetical protein